MHVRYIVTSGGLYGYFGVGDTLADADAVHAKTYRKHTGRRRPKGETLYAVRYHSALPFCPATEKRDATDDESDAYVGRDGSSNWVRCVATKVDPKTGAPIDEPNRYSIPVDDGRFADGWDAEMDVTAAKA